ncbi:expressed protein [Arabidopsis lyrata subsp. lyrata]|uniref:Expressed protein n=1 Tax=Arabidopsis lyrata subsp. lyrata TaxID=81972 RepID=D7M884_ARALL|nr:expressed protein [Arabidopsis lyrata subsp. lyrata]
MMKMHVLVSRKAREMSRRIKDGSLETITMCGEDGKAIKQAYSFPCSSFSKSRFFLTFLSIPT